MQPFGFHPEFPLLRAHYKQLNVVFVTYAHYRTPCTLNYLAFVSSKAPHTVRTWLLPFVMVNRLTDVGGTGLTVLSSSPSSSLTSSSTADWMRLSTASSFISCFRRFDSVGSIFVPALTASLSLQAFCEQQVNYFQYFWGCLWEQQTWTNFMIKKPYHWHTR